MPDIYVYRATDLYGGRTIRYRIGNINDLSLTLDQPVSPMALPQETSEQNVLVKMEGNTETINISWNIHDVDSSNPVIKQKESSSSSGEILDDSLNDNLSLADPAYYDSNQIVGHLLSSFQGYNIGDRYYIAIPKVTGEVIFKEGFITRINCNISGDSPVVWQASLTMIVGNVISIYDADTPNEPRNVAAAQVGSTGSTSDSPKTKIRLRWQAPSDTATSITKYRIYRRDDTGSYVLAHDINDSGLDGAVSSDTAYKEYGVTGLTSGKVYIFKIAAINSGGQGTYSDEVSATFP